MTHFAFIAPPLPSHVSALEPLVQALKGRGHRVTWVLPPGAPLQAIVSGAPVVSLALTGDYELDPVTAGSPAKAILWHRASEPAGWFALRGLILAMARTTAFMARFGRAALDRIDPDVLVVDQMEAAGGLLARSLRLPFVSIANALPVNREPLLPLPVMPFAYADDEAARHRVAVSTAVYDWLMRPHARAIRQACAQLGVPLCERLDQCVSDQLQISQTPLAFDLPRRSLPSSFHAVGPMRLRSSDQPLALPIAPDRPFVFSSLGTLQGGRFKLHQAIAQACRRENVQLLLAHCGRLNAAQCEQLKADGATWVTDFADQRAAIARADAVICHGGLNTVLDAIDLGTPTLAVPLGNDQPGAVARLERSGAGLKVAPRAASATTLAHALRRLLSEPGFAQRARQTGEACRREAGGLALATTLVESLGSDRTRAKESMRVA